MAKDCFCVHLSLVLNSVCTQIWQAVFQVLPGACWVRDFSRPGSESSAIKESSRVWDSSPAPSSPPAHMRAPRVLALGMGMGDQQTQQSSWGLNFGEFWCTPVLRRSWFGHADQTGCCAVGSHLCFASSCLHKCEKQRLLRWVYTKLHGIRWKKVCHWGIWKCILLHGDDATLLLAIVGCVVWYQF